MLQYMMAKESVKYPTIVEAWCPAYRTPDSAKAFTSFIAESFHQGFLDKLSSSEGPKFFSFLIDDTTDPGNQEDQLIVLVYCDKNEVTINEITTCTRYFSVHTPARADASGILNCIKDALKQVGIEDLLDSECVLVENFPGLVGGGTDGAAVNVAGTGGLKGQLTEALPCNLLVVVLRPLPRTCM